MVHTKNIVLQFFFAMSVLGFVSFHASPVYGRIFVRSDVNTFKNEGTDGTLISAIKNITGDVIKINGNKSRFMFKVNVEKNLPDSELEKKILSQVIVDELLVYAYSYLGTPYRYGGSTKRGIDCSAFVMSVYKMAADIKLPRTSVYQAMEGKRISKSELKRGDLVFFADPAKRRISHVGIVENVSESGEVRFIHAASSRGVMVSSLKNSYWGRRFRYAKRIVS